MYVLLARRLLLLLRPVVTARSIGSVRVAGVAVTINTSLALLAVPFGTVLTGSRLRLMAVVVFGAVVMVVHFRVLDVIDTFSVRWLLCLLLVLLLLLLLTALDYYIHNDYGWVDVLTSWYF